MVSILEHIQCQRCAYHRGELYGIWVKRGTHLAYLYLSIFYWHWMCLQCRSGGLSFYFRAFFAKEMLLGISWHITEQFTFYDFSDPSPTWGFRPIKVYSVKIWSPFFFFFFLPSYYPLPPQYLPPPWPASHQWSQNSFWHRIDDICIWTSQLEKLETSFKFPSILFQDLEGETLDAVVYIREPHFLCVAVAPSTSAIFDFWVFSRPTFLLIS